MALANGMGITAQEWRLIREIPLFLCSSIRDGLFLLVRMRLALVEPEI